MADLQLVNFALIPSLVRKGEQFGLPDDLSKIVVTNCLTDEPFHVQFSRGF